MSRQCREGEAFPLLPGRPEPAKTLFPGLYVETLSEARTKLEGFFNILLGPRVTRRMAAPSP